MYTLHLIAGIDMNQLHAWNYTGSDDAGFDIMDTRAAGMNFFKASPLYWSHNQRLRDLVHRAKNKASPWAGWAGLFRLPWTQSD